MVKITVLDGKEIDVLKKLPLRVLVCILLPILSTFLLSYFDLAYWSTNYHGAISMLLIILGYIIPIIHLSVFLFAPYPWYKKYFSSDSSELRYLES